MTLKLLGFESFDIVTTYNILLSDEPSNYIIGSNEWINTDFVNKNILYRIDMVVFEEIFDKVLKNFPHYDCYDITEFQGLESEKLSHLLEQERQINTSLSDALFRQKYEFIYTSIKHDKEFIATYDKEKLDELIRDDVDTIIMTLIQALRKTLDENKTLTIVGI